MKSFELGIFFLDLPGFHPVYDFPGILGNDFDRFGFVSYREHRIFKKDNSIDLNYLIRFWGFDSIEVRGKKVWISERNLYFVLTRPHEVRVNHGSDLSNELLKQIEERFLKGYEDGEVCFTKELGVSFPGLSLEEKLRHLKNLIEVSDYYLFFDGYLAPTYLYSIGYIQAVLVLACKEFRNLFMIKKPGIHNFSFKEIQVEETTPAPEIQVDAPKVADKIPLYHPFDEISTLWMSLLDFHHAPYFQTSPYYHSKSQIIDLLGMMFQDGQKGSQALLPDTAPVLVQVPPGNYKLILNLLMHATYKLNQASGHGKVKLSKYSEVLKRTFSCYSSIAEDNLTKDFTRYIQDTCSVLKKMPEESYAYKSLSILKNIKEYKI